MESIAYPLLGGIIIGLSSTTMLGGVGRITGISGIFGDSLDRPSLENLWRYAFLAGLILGGALLKIFMPELFNYDVPTNIPLVVVAGMLVGYGTRLGSGCTSGHGVCGMARMANRSIVATMTFILAGMITVAIKGAIL